MKILKEIWRKQILNRVLMNCDIIIYTAGKCLSSTYQTHLFNYVYVRHMYDVRTKKLILFCRNIFLSWNVNRPSASFKRILSRPYSEKRPAGENMAVVIDFNLWLWLYSCPNPFQSLSTFINPLINWKICNKPWPGSSCFNSFGLFCFLWRFDYKLLKYNYEFMTVAK